MAYEPLHHKYRPQTFGDLVGQETISLTLNNALAQAKIAPAYLFTGPRGTGKTSSARILAKSLNCLASDRPTPHPCGKCEVCLAIAKGSALDVMEIDAASNTGVDNIREIIERSRFAPVQCRYKIYAVDECHMLSVAAFNALLKTLEEPPPQVVFILATTDPQRVLSTIISRCQRFDYRRIPLTAMTSHLKYIADAEAIVIADDALTLVAQIANGGLRDAESLLDQLSLLPDTITVEKVWDLVGAVPEQDLLKLLHEINRNNSVAVLQQCRSLLDRGREPLVVLQNLVGFYLNLLIAKTAPNNAELTAVTETCWQQLCQEADNWQTARILHGQQLLKEAEAQLKRTTQPRLWLEVTLLGLLPEAYQSLAVPPTSPTSLTSPASIASPATSAPIAPTIPSTNSTADSITPPTAPKEATSPTASSREEQNKNRQNLAQSTHLQQTPFPAVATATPVLPKPTVTNNQDPIANQQIWSKVVSCLQPPTTQALLKQQCHLVSFDGTSAIVGVSSAKLQKMTQQKIPNIEAAFTQVCQEKVKVQLEVASSQSNTTHNTLVATHQPVVTTSTSPPKQPPDPPPPPRMQIASSSENVSLKPQSLPSQNQATIASASSTLTASDRPQELTSDTLKHSSLASANNHQVVTTSAPSTTNISLENFENNVSNNVSFTEDNISDNTEVTLDEDYGDSELQQAIASLTQSFEGEVVQLDNLDSLNSRASLATIDDLDLNDAPFAGEEEEEEEEEEKILIPPEIPNYSDRPDVEDYHDEW